MGRIGKKFDWLSIPGFLGITIGLFIPGFNWYLIYIAFKDGQKFRGVNFFRYFFCREEDGD